MTGVLLVISCSCMYEEMIYLVAVRDHEEYVLDIVTAVEAMMHVN